MVGLHTKVSTLLVTEMRFLDFARIDLATILSIPMYVAIIDWIFHSMVCSGIAEQRSNVLIVSWYT